MVRVQLVARQGRSRCLCAAVTTRPIRVGYPSLYSGLARPNLTTSIPCVAQLGLPLPTNHCQDCPSVRSESAHPPGAIPTSDSKLRTPHKIQCNCVRIPPSRPTAHSFQRDAIYLPT